MRIASIALGCVFTFSALAARADDRAALSAERSQTFVVQSLIDGRQAFIGGGVLVARSGDVMTIATAAHVVNGPPERLRILDTTRRAYYEVLHVRLLLEYDLAFIRVRAQPGYAAAPPAIAVPQPGEPVMLWGHPAQSFWRLASGSVVQPAAQLPGEDGSPRITIVCPNCEHGDSGSGVFDGDGRLIGILTQAWRQARDGPVRFIEVEPASLISQEAQIEDSAASR